MDKVHEEYDEEPALEDVQLEEAVTKMSPDDRIQHKREWLSTISDLEMLCNLVDRVNASEGIEVDIIY